MTETVDVYRASLSADPSGFESCLSPEERARADGLAFPRGRARFVASRGHLRVLLARLAGGTPASQAIVAGGTCGQGSIRFNVSHSGDLWACAVAVGREVGLDVEAVDPDRKVSSLATRHFSRAEADALAALPAAERTAAFHRVWTRKEAWLKARGFGISVPLDSFEVTHGAGDARLLATRPDPAEAARWTLRDLDLGPGFAGCVAAEGEVREVRLAK